MSATNATKGWSEKDKRQYEHIKKSELEQGTPEDRAQEIAAATVNKHRSQEGRTEQSPQKKKKG